jgi:alpha/beta superfamily hydrolase
MAMAAIDLRGPAGRLEGILEGVAAPRLAAVVCHPHPLFGGTMHTHAVHRMARAIRLAGGLSLRFNYRGVGLSEGRYDQGRGEADDAEAALAFLAGRHPDLPRLCCGFSFGAFVALAAGPRDPGVRGLLLAGLALEPAADLPRDLGPLRALPLPVAVVQAEHDQFGAPDQVRAVLEGSAGPRRVAEVWRATHLFTEALDDLQLEAEAAVGWLLDSAAHGADRAGTPPPGRGQ